MSREPLSYADPSTPVVPSGRGRGPVYLGVAAVGMMVTIIVGQSLAIRYRSRDLELVGILLIPSQIAAIVCLWGSVARMRSLPRIAGVCLCLLLCYLCLYAFWYITLSDSGR
jgi:hypothetical protein